MKKYFHNIIISVVFIGVIVFIDRVNLNNEQYAIKYLQDKISVCEKSIVNEEIKDKELLVFENTNEKVIQLSDWGINDFRDILHKNFIVNNTGWYWIIHTKDKRYVLKFKYIFPVNNQYLNDTYAKCLDISDEYVLEYSEHAQQIKDSNGKFLPVILKHYPKYKYKSLVNINAFFYCLWWLLLFYFIIKIIPKIWWYFISFVVVMLLRWAFFQWHILSLLNDSVLYDIKAYAFPKIYFLQYLGDVLILVMLYALLSYKLFEHKYFLLSYLNILLQSILLISCIYLFTHYSSFTLNVIDNLFYHYPYWVYDIIALSILFYLILHLAFLLTNIIFQKYSLYQYGLIIFGILFISVYLIFYYQNNNIKNKTEYIFNWVENEEELALFEQIQTIDKFLGKITELNDSVYFKNISDIENSSVYLQLSKRYLFEDSLSLNNYLKDKKRIWNNVYIDNKQVSDKLSEYSTKNFIIDNIYYINKIDRKYLLSEFDYFLPFSNKSYYSFLSEKIFQLPSGFKNFDIAYYESNQLKFKTGDLSFPPEFSNIGVLNIFYPEYIHHQKVSENKNIIISHPKTSLSDFISLFSIYFILLLTVFLIAFYIYYAWKYKHWFPINHIPYFYKITGLVMFISLVSFYMLLIVSYQYIRHLLDSEIKKVLLKEAQTLKKENITDNIIVFNKNGYLQGTNVSNALIRFKLLPFKLPDKWVKKILSDKYFYAKREIGSYEYTSLFVLLENSIITELSYFDEQIFVEKNLKALLNPLFNIYGFLFLISFILGVSLSNYIVLPIRNIAQQLQTPLELKTIPYEAKDELGDLVKNYNHLVIRLQGVLEQLKKEQQEKAWKLMAQQIAHDIKNSLTPLLLNIEYLKKQVPPSKNYESIINSIIQQVQMLSRIAEDFSEFAQDIQIKPENVNIRKLLEDIITPYKTYKNIQVSLSIHPETPPFIYTDAYLLSRVINNLIKNSIEAIETEGKILIELYKENQTVVIAVSDNGCGISDEIKDKIFEPKFSTKTSGKGLGLSIVKNICDKLSIHIHFKTQLNQGTVFYLNIPL